MGFPFLEKPFDGWVKDKLEKREETKLIEQSRYMPFVWISSGMVVNKGKRPTNTDDALKGAIYKGCVLSNHLEIGTKYSEKESILGYDLTGKPIKVENEKGLKVSPPIIESLEIDQTGENGTLKTGKLTITIFSQKQLEMFELFFLKPSALLVLEYGVNNPFTKQSVLNTSFIRYKDWDNYADAVLDNFSSDTEIYSKKRGEYIQNIQKTNGDYDYWICRVHDFAVSYESEDNIYKVELTVATGNELHLWTPIKQQKPDPNKANQQTGVQKQPTKGNNPTPITFLEELLSDLSLAENTITALKNKITASSTDFFNWGVKSETSNADNVSKTQYISMKLILDILNEAPIFKTYKSIISYEHIKHDGQYFIPINSHKDIISTNQDFIIPGNLPKIVADVALPTKIGVKPDKRVNREINGKKFNFQDPEITLTLSNKKYKIPGTVGNLLNLFVSKDLFIKIWKDRNTYAEFIDELFTMINGLMFGLCKIEIAKLEGELNAEMTIIDKKLRQEYTTNVIEYGDKKAYRFKIDPLKSIMYDFNFNLQMSELAAAQAIYESQLSLFEATQDKNQTQGASFPLTDREFLKILGATNADNMYSLDYLNHLNNKKNKAKNMKEADDQKQTVNGEKTTPNTETNTDVKALESIIKGKSIKFLPIDKTKEADTLIYSDIALIQSLITKSAPGTSVLTYLETDFTIDGMAGISFGQMFHIDGVPEIYNINGAFQIMNIKHSIQPDQGWRTTINAAYRLDVKL